MKKSKLKSGMLVVNRERNRAIVLIGTSNGDVIAGDDVNTGRTWSPLTVFNDDLTYPGLLSSDIVEVWSFSCNKAGVSLSGYDERTLLWKREDEKTVIKLNGRYEATVSSASSEVTVGCQAIQIDTIREVLAAYEKLNPTK